MTSDQQPCFAFSFSDDTALDLDLPRCFTPVGDNLMDFDEWEPKGLMSREQSFGPTMVSLQSEPSDAVTKNIRDEVLCSNIHDDEPTKQNSWMDELVELFGLDAPVCEQARVEQQTVFEKQEVAYSANSPVGSNLHNDLHNHQSSCTPVGSKRRAPEGPKGPEGPEEEEEGADEIGNERIDNERECQPIKRRATGTQAVRRRGAHVRERPEMQELAREGQAHWGSKVVELRSQWERMRMWEHNEHFGKQVQMCRVTHVKSQHECLLRQLQMALVAGWITASPFSTSAADSFLGWTGFAVVSESGASFRRSVEEMFASPPKERTLNNTLRRAGMIAKEGWTEAWSGSSSFVFDKQKRAHYATWVQEVSDGKCDVSREV
eukprot:CAMPEP_0181313454 /NCGR_PEP_ID=MMETSP1101-20121128/14254_1 /TAXON_ID=46948 /ORGANISM="Rhodomonas abbreviata, Strain Caron Lab Isolate" /LENGTH=376 /DNA_ID=CAMNT_0023420403 /DNA_START=29 /DNA_END=1158 /DNA_ORIENTATION=+